MSQRNTRRGSMTQEMEIIALARRMTERGSVDHQTSVMDAAGVSIEAGLNLDGKEMRRVYIRCLSC